MKLEEDRAITLLRATLELLRKYENSPYADVLVETAHYDEADCDGYCLMDDISNYLDYELKGQDE